MKYVIMTGLAFLLAGLSCGLAIPASPVMISPGNNGTEVGDSPALKVSVSDPNNGDLRVVFYGRRAQADYGPDFMIVALPDTQYYVSSKHGGKPAMFYAQTDWIKANRTASNIVYVTQLGDCVEDGDTNAGPDNLAEWRYSTNALYRIETPFDFLHPDGIPYGVAVGNHDQSPNGDPDGTTTYYNQYFGESHFSGRGYYGGHYGTNNDNFFDLFNASGMDFIVVYLEFDPNANPVVLNWASNVLQTYPSRRAIVVSHYIGKPGTPSSFGPQGAAIYAALKANPNLFLMLSGHVNGEGSRQDTFNFHTVYTLVSDYQFRTNGGNGFMRLMQFSPSNNVIRVSTFSPWLNQYETDADSEFTVPYAMQSSSASFTAISTNINVSSGAVTSATWTGLQPNSDYEWQVKVTDALGNSVIGPTWRFTTGAVNSPPVATNAT
ncbi:MAG TPA: phosphohydrolase, partial [Candidatus Binatia bacterium]|nr:phosphohydrolase [Candidatus Binatia bacterium]